MGNSYKNMSSHFYLNEKLNIFINISSREWPKKEKKSS